MPASCPNFAGEDTGARAYEIEGISRRSEAREEDLAVQLWPYSALAEALDAPLITVGARLTRANGPRYAMHTYSP